MSLRSVQDDVPEVWVCDDCKMLTCVNEQATIFEKMAAAHSKKEKDQTDRTEDVVFRQVSERSAPGGGGGVVETS